MQIRLLSSTLPILAALLTPLRAEVVGQTANIAGATVHYKVVLPDGYDPAKEYPAVLAFSGGGQTMNTVENEVRSVWRAQAEKRGYIVVIPAAFDEDLYLGADARIFPAFLDTILADYKIRDGKFHIAGSSNGGISAFNVAAANPKYFLSVTSFPGYLNNATPDRIAALKNMCIYMFAGSEDPDWVEAMEAQSGIFRTRGYSVTAQVEAGEPHRMQTLRDAGAARLFDQFDASAKGCAK